ncbi:MAG: tetratricopeptide repeat protein [Alistipes sp.]|nr:tetratricopeptide repeat protein [Alistipes sp.]
MTNKVETPQQDVMIEAKGKLETFFEKYSKQILYGLLIVACVCVIFFFWRSRSERQARVTEANAQVALVAAYDAIELNDYAGAAAAAENVVSQYEGTDAANLAAYIAGASYVKLGDFDNARKYLAKYEAREGAAAEMIDAMALGLQGDIAVEQDDLQAAAGFFAKAAAASTDPVTEPMFLRKLAAVYAAQGEQEKAAECYRKIVEKYPAQAATVEKYLK